MQGNYSLKADPIICERIIKEQIYILNDLQDINEIKNAFKQINVNMLEVLDSNEVLAQIKSKEIYLENEYSKIKTKESIIKAKEKVIEYLEELIVEINNISSILNDEISQEVAITIIKRILNNFYAHIETMYEQPTHGRAGITKEKLDNIKIVNEYDVQRILYSLIKPVFPEARVEVSNDTGFSTVRYDIFIEKYSIIIEVKCTRVSMTERSLTEEIGADIYHYEYSNIFFFIYDKEKIIKNKVAFENTYNKSFNEKSIITTIIQPINL
ncbi:hypothetical protein LF65_00082 [Clostridium beijerinckii]|uniref:Uncharacterized protein n=1 Tax=Clostridium beijerinckii TaxID=1520 RepID=A0A0B5QJD1_CLOBE|nr:hypothetical protein [Clostridium beijerinckii]AJG96773.1 hypothetical protein LF65_00082 [Clostridium beijerinckii]